MAMGLDAAAFASADGAATPYYAPPSTVGTPMTMGKWVKNTDEMCAVAQRVVENGQRLRHLCALKVQLHRVEPFGAHPSRLRFACELGTSVSIEGSIGEPPVER